MRKKQRNKKTTTAKFDNGNFWDSFLCKNQGEPKNQSNLLLLSLRLEDLLDNLLFLNQECADDSVTNAV
jgi:hypothetical protein